MPKEQRVFVHDIPSLDAPPSYQYIEGDDPFPRVRLPSGHVAAHVTRYDDVLRVLGNPALSRTACNVEDGPTFLPGPTQKELLLNLDMPAHARSRQLVSKDFSPQGVGALREIVRTTAESAVAEMIEGKRPPDVFQSVLQEVTVTTMCHILGIPLEDRAFFRPWSQIIQSAPKDDIAGIESAVRSSFDYLLDFVRGTRRAAPEGFIRRHADGRVDQANPLSDEEVVGVLLGILLGGDHNALSVMTKCVYTLLCAPALWNQLVEDPDLVPAMVEELIRCIPIGKLSVFPRIAMRAVPASFGTIPEGTPLYINAFLANRDPEVYHDPLVIDPRRKTKPHLQFGHGVHTCMGPHLARLEITVVLQTLTRHAPTMHLNATPASLRWIDGTVLRRPDELPVNFS
jgi:cytochrome P450